MGVVRGVELCLCSLNIEQCVFKFDIDIKKYCVQQFNVHIIRKNVKERKKERIPYIWQFKTYYFVYNKEQTNLNYRHHVIINFSSNCRAHSSVETLV